jgi:branched-chain amino acid transport system substrate-binding protein
MRPERRRWLAAGVVAAVVATAAAVVAIVASAGPRTAMRIGVVTDCTGIGRSLRGAERSGAQAPLLERGAHRRGGGVTTATVAGRPVRLVWGCTEALEFSTLTRELRRLAEDEHVDAVVAAGTGSDEVVLRDVARAHPGVVFVPVVHGPREVTLRRPARNLYGVAADHAQGVAGLATYARRDLGWRTAAVVYGNWDLGWQAREAFLAEFCALGGRVTQQLQVDFFDPAGGDVAKLPPEVDGVVVLAGSFFGPGAFLRRVAARSGDPARHLLVGPGIADDPRLLQAGGAALRGVVGSSHADPDRMRAFVRRHVRRFPGQGAAVAAGEAVTGYRNAVEALLQALERAGGDPSRLRAALSRARLHLLAGTVRLDAHRQAVAPTTLVRIGAPPTRGGAPVLHRVRTIAAVDQSLGGLLADGLRPADRPSGCRRGATPPPWSG